VNVDAGKDGRPYGRERPRLRRVASTEGVAGLFRALKLRVRVA